MTNLGPNPPPVLRLSDGGHIENLAILPLLKKRLKKIVVADGGHKNKDGEWGESLLKALTLAREKLHCSFIGIDGRDVIEDVICIQYIKGQTLPLYPFIKIKFIKRLVVFDY